jgi:hypothetical protein
MSKKAKTDETTTEPTADEVIAAWNEVARIGIAKDLDVKVQWSTPNIATSHNAYRLDVSRALAPPPLDLPRPPRDEPPRTDPPARTRAQVDGRR